MICKDEELRVHTAAEMSGWLVRPYRRTAVFFQGRRYYIADKVVLGNRTIRYLLKPWAELHDLPGNIIYYDEDYVRERDETNRIQRRRFAQRVVWLIGLFPLVPIIGFLWAPTKTKIEKKVGVSSKTATISSLVVEYICLLSCSVLLQVTIWAALAGRVFGQSLFFLNPGQQIFFFNPLFFVLPIVLIVPDIVMRADKLMRKSSFYPGFYEWLFRFGSGGTN